METLTSAKWDFGCNKSNLTYRNFLPQLKKCFVKQVHEVIIKWRLHISQVFYKTILIRSQYKHEHFSSYLFLKDWKVPQSWNRWIKCKSTYMQVLKLHITNHWLKQQDGNPSFFLSQVSSTVRRRHIRNVITLGQAITEH